ncbi:MAG: hypothetical protein QNK92_06180 [Amylibacter sp.]
MNAKAFAIAILIFTAPFGATAQETCNLSPDSPENCDRFVGCFTEGETVISGTARRWESGAMYGETPEGLSCSGTLKFDGFVEKGKSKISYSDGDSVEISFFSRGDTIQPSQGLP